MTATVTRGLATLMRQQPEPTREALRELRQHLVDEARDQNGERKVIHYYAASPRMSNALVRLPLGSGQDPNVLATTL